MRKDMSKVVIERPRRGHRLPSSKTRLRVRQVDFDYDDEFGFEYDDAFDDLPDRVSGSRSKYLRKDPAKSFNDLLGPLRRFLRSNVGRPWNIIHSEMSQSLDDRKTAGRHVFDYIASEVKENCYEEGGVIYSYNSRGGSPRPVEGLYVDPRTGLLCWREKPIPEKRDTAKEWTRIWTRRTKYIKQDGVWYIAEIRRCVSTPDPQPTWPVFTDHLSWQWWVLRKKQCNTKELRAARLKNDPVIN
jgi:hypothetical protein